MAEIALEERVARMEGKVEGFAQQFSALQEQGHATQLRLEALDHKIDRFRDELSGRIDGLDQRLGGRIDELNQRLSTRIDRLDHKIDRNFQWTTGINVVLWSTILVSIFFRT